MITSVEFDTNVTGLLNSLGNVSQLSFKETLSLLEQKVHGNSEAKKKLIYANSKYVFTRAKHYYSPFVSISDLFQSGLLGLTSSVNKATPEIIKNYANSHNIKDEFALVAYATNEIDNSIKDTLIELEPFKVSDYQFRRIRKVRGIDNKLISSTSLTEDERIEVIAKKLNITEKQVRQSFAASDFSVSLDAPAQNSEDNSQTSFGDIISNKNSDYLINSIFHNDFIRDINLSLHILSPLEKNVVELYFGLNGRESLSLDSIGKRFGHTKQWASLTLKKAYASMKNSRYDLDGYAFAS